jgi:hypothetical protein
MQVIAGVSRECDPSLLSRMIILTMTAASPDVLPSVILYELYQVADFHLASRLIFSSNAFSGGPEHKRRDCFRIVPGSPTANSAQVNASAHLLRRSLPQHRFHVQVADQAVQIIGMQAEQFGGVRVAALGLLEGV